MRWKNFPVKFLITELFFGYTEHSFLSEAARVCYNNFCRTSVRMQIFALYPAKICS